MKIESVDFFYLSMPEVLDIGDGSQDALLVRIRAGNYEGWGECEASPLTSIASYVCPMSHSACKPLKYSLEGKSINDAQDIYAISRSVHENSLDLLQANHTLSGIDIALWDLLGKKAGVPVYQLLGYKKAYPKLPYASQLFGNSPEDTFEKAASTIRAGYKAAKFGWGGFGKSGLTNDINHLQAAREGLGPDAILMVDAGTIFGEDIAAAKERLVALKAVNTYWFEEPFVNGALYPYKTLSAASPPVPLAGGEGCSNFVQAQAMIAYGGLSFIQIDAGRIGGITVAKRVADLAVQYGVTYVNHTFNSHLALSASLQSYAGIEKDIVCEYPVELKSLAQEIGREKILRGEDGRINLPDRPGLGITVDMAALKKYLVDVEIRVNGKNLYYTPEC
ncbi:mandelate racemase/muconate lactonizing enzyme family protein [Flavihumibacter fluvii]|uniref:mandelate racemase/muconate lactonizing enzyme family protein n=1 Tax=Flavihumibacter fluvii TaxID=2838157 RepID=UPI001BDDCFA7|nr:mandelate racemase/muconate lactonizing enzyme family protein [Flavihumibacter fluvii]ULQ52443.1 mandelate racemase/muconate lactonizing enzyme family protein [Flavihumibacter fluvii]